MINNLHHKFNLKLYDYIYFVISFIFSININIIQKYNIKKNYNKEKRNQKKTNNTAQGMTKIKIMQHKTCNR